MAQKEETVVKIVRPADWQSTLAENPDSLSVATFNTLRRGYQFNKKYWVPDSVRAWEFRYNLHKSLLASLGTDIVCLQEAEVSTFDEDFGFAESLGYSAFKPVCKKGEHEHTKPSMLYKKSRLTLKWQNSRTRTIIALFEDLKTGKNFFVINGHLQGGDGQTDQRINQLRSAFQQLQNQVKSMKLKDEDITCFVCGDFNDTMESPVHSFIKDGKLATADIDKIFKGKFVFQHTFNLGDSHGALSATDRPYTFKWGVKEDAIFQTIDFIYFSRAKLDVQCIRHPLSQEQQDQMKETLGIPNTWNPSDHLPTAALFKIK